MLNLTRGLRRDPPLVRTMTVVGERNRGRAVECAHSQVGPGQRHGSGGGGWGQPGLTSSEAGCRGSERARLMTEEHCSGSGTGPGHAQHARQETQGTYLKVAALKRGSSGSGKVRGCGSRHGRAHAVGAAVKVSLPWGCCEGERRKQGEDTTGLTAVVAHAGRGKKK